MICTKGFDEATALRVGYAYEQATAWHRQTPDLSWASARTEPKHMPSLAPPGRKGGSLMEFLVSKDPGSQEERLGFVPVSNGDLLTTNVAFEAHVWVVRATEGNIGRQQIAVGYWHEPETLFLGSGVF